MLGNGFIQYDSIQAIPRFDGLSLRLAFLRPFHYASLPWLHLEIEGEREKPDTPARHHYPSISPLLSPPSFNLLLFVVPSLVGEVFAGISFM